MSAERTERLIAHMRELKSLFHAIKQDANELDVENLNEYIGAYSNMQSQIVRFIGISAEAEIID